MPQELPRSRSRYPSDLWRVDAVETNTEPVNGPLAVVPCRHGKGVTIVYANDKPTADVGHESRRASIEAVYQKLIFKGIG